MASGAISAYGGKFKYGDGGAPEAFTEVPEVQSTEFSGVELDDVEVTNMASPNAVAEHVGTIVRGGDLTVKFKYIPGNAVHEALRAMVSARAVRNFEVHYPAANGKKESFSALPKKFDFSGAFDGVLEGTFTLKLTSIPTQSAA